MNTKLTQASSDGELTEKQNEIRHFIKHNHPEKGRKKEDMRTNVEQFRTFGFNTITKIFTRKQDRGLKGTYVFHVLFSNSLIIHRQKTKEITAVYEVWKCDLNYPGIKFGELLL